MNSYLSCNITKGTTAQNAEKTEEIRPIHNTKRGALEGGFAYSTPFISLTKDAKKSQRIRLVSKRHTEKYLNKNGQIHTP